MKIRKTFIALLLVFALVLPSISGYAEGMDDTNTTISDPEEVTPDDNTMSESKESMPTKSDENSQSESKADSPSNSDTNSTANDKEESIAKDKEASVEKNENKAATPALSNETSADNLSKKDEEKQDDKKSDAKEDEKKGGENATRDDPSSSEPHFDITWVGGLNSVITSTGNKAYASTEPKNDVIVATPIDDANSEHDSHSSGGNTEKYYVSSQLHFSMGRSAHPIEVGDIKIVIPRYIFTEWDWNEENWTWEGGKPVAPAGQPHKPSDPNIGVPKKPGTDDKGFYWYYSDADGNEVSPDQAEGAVHITISNHRSMADLGNAPIDLTCMINWAYHPAKVNETIPANIKVDLKINDDEYQNLAIENDTLKASIKTGSELTNARKEVYNHYTQWDSRWGTAPDPEYMEKDAYRFVIYRVRATVMGEKREGNARNSITQPFVLTLADKTGEIISDGTDGRGVGEIVAVYKQWERGPGDGISFTSFETGSVTDGINQVIFPRTASGSTDTIEIDVKRGRSPAYDYLFFNEENFYTYVICAYKAEEFPADTYVTNTATVSKLPYSTEDEAEYKTAEKKETWQNIEFNYDGDEGGFYKENRNFDNSYPQRYKMEDIEGAKYLLENGKEAVLDTFVLGTSSVGVRGFGLTQEDVSDYGQMTELREGRYYHTITYSTDPEKYYKHPYSIELMDTQLFLEGELLTDEDYDIVGARYSTYNESYMEMEEFKISSNRPEDVPAPKNYLYYRTDISEDWIKIAEDVAKGETFTDIPENAIQIKWAFETYAYKVQATSGIDIKLKPTEHVLSLIKDIDKPQVTNIASFATRDYLGRVWDDAPEDTIDADTSLRDQVAAHDENGNNGLEEGRYFVHDWAIQYLTDVSKETVFEKAGWSEDNRDSLTSNISYTLKLRQEFYVKTDDPDKTISLLDEIGDDYGVFGKEFVFYDLLPEGVLLDNESGPAVRAFFEKDGWSSSQVDGEIISQKEIPNYKGTNRTLLVVTCKLPDDFTDRDNFITYNSEYKRLNLSSQVRLNIKGTVSWDALTMYGIGGTTMSDKLQINYAAGSWPGSGDGTNDDCVDQVNSNADLLPDEIKEVMVGLRQNDSIEQAEGNDIYYSKASTAYNIATASLTGYTKTVKSSIENSYRINSAEVHDGQYSYQLRLAMQPGTMAKDIIIYDALETSFIDPMYMEVGDHAGKYHLYDPPRYWRGTFDHVDTSYAETLGAKVDVYYSTTPRVEMQVGLNNNYSGTAESAKYADLTNTNYWSREMPSDKSTITAVAFDVRKDQDGNDFIIENDGEKSPVLLLYIYMNAPDAEEIMNGRSEPKHLLPNGQYDTEASLGSYMDPHYVYAYNNSFLSIRTKSIASNTWGLTGARMSDGTTIRLAEPTPPIYKQVESIDGDRKAGKTIADEDKEISQNTVYLNDPTEEFKYTISTRVPILGIDAANKEKSAVYYLSDSLKPEIVFAEDDDFKLRIGNESSDSYLVYEANGAFTDEFGTPHKGYMKVWHGEYDEENPTAKKYEIAYFDEFRDFPKGIEVSKYSSTSTYVSLRLLHPEAVEDSGPVDCDYNRVRDFEGEEVYIEFKAKILEGSALGKYTNDAAPNTASYSLDYSPREYSNVVYVKPPTDDEEKPKKKVSLKDEEGNSITEEDVTQHMDDVKKIIHYSVEGKIPGNAAIYEIVDEVEKVLEIIPDSVRVTISGEGKQRNGQVVYASREFTPEDLICLNKWGDNEYSASKSKVSYSINDEFINQRGDYLMDSDISMSRIIPRHQGRSPSGYANYNDYDFGLVGFTVRIDFDAKIKDGADLTPYTNKDSVVEIPNVAQYQFKNYSWENTNPVTVTNKKFETSVKITKIWDDKDNAEGNRPGAEEFAKLIKLLGDGEAVDFLNDDEITYAAKDNNDGTYTVVIEHLPKFNTGKEIKYTIEEDEIEGYSLVSNEDKKTEDSEYAAEVELKNKSGNPVIEVKGKKTWDDKGNADGIRPEKITVILLANGEEKDRIEVAEGEDGNWSYSFKELPKYDGNEELISYEIDEEDVEGYEKIVEGYDLTNKHEPEESTPPDENSVKPDRSDKTNKTTKTTKTTTPVKPTTSKAARTGDETRPAIWIAMMTLAVVLGYLAVMRRRRKK